MGKTNQAGWVGLRGKKWYGYFRRVLDPTTEKPKVDIVCVPLGLKTQVTKSAAREALRMEVAKPLALRLGIPRLNFQILRRTMATQAQNMGSVKDIQAHLRHAKADTTANEYMQELPESVQDMVGSVYLMLANGAEQKHGSGDLQQNATKPTIRGNAKLLKGLVGTAGFEPTTSTV
jgi:hypothetical protein